MFACSITTNAVNSSLSRFEGIAADGVGWATAAGTAEADGASPALGRAGDEH